MYAIIADFDTESGYDKKIVCKYGSYSAAYRKCRQLNERSLHIGYSVVNCEKTFNVKLSDLSESCRNFLISRHLDKNQAALAVANCYDSLDDSVAADFRNEVYAVESNIANHGKLAEKAKMFGWTGEMVNMAVRACSRHEDTDYEARLASGMSRDEARATKSAL